MLKRNLKRLLLLKEHQSVASKWHRCSVDKQSLQLPWNPRTFDNRTIWKFPCSVFPACSPCSFLRTYLVEHRVRTLCSVPNNVREHSLVDADVSFGEDDSLDKHTKPLSKEELMARAVSQRAKFDEKLSEANEQIRYLKRQLMALLADSQRAKLNQKLSVVSRRNQELRQQLHDQCDTLINIKDQLALTEVQLEVALQSLCTNSGEISKLGIREGSRKRNGKCKSDISPKGKIGECIESNVLSWVTVILERFKELIKGIEAELQLKEVTLTWHGEAECVEVMGSFNRWREVGEFLSPESTDSGQKFSTTLMLPPGRYEIIFSVDHEWQLSHELPVVGKGIMSNNLLVVE